MTARPTCAMGGEGPRSAIIDCEEESVSAISSRSSVLSDQEEVLYELYKDMRV